MGDKSGEYGGHMCSVFLEITRVPNIEWFFHFCAGFLNHLHHHQTWFDREKTTVRHMSRCILTSVKISRIFKHFFIDFLKLTFVTVDMKRTVPNFLGVSSIENRIITFEHKYVQNEHFSQVQCATTTCKIVLETAYNSKLFFNLAKD